MAGACGAAGEPLGRGGGADPATAGESESPLVATPPEGAAKEARCRLGVSVLRMHAPAAKANCGAAAARSARAADEELRGLRHWRSTICVGAAGETTSRQRRQESSQIVSESFAKANSCKTAVSSFSLELFVCKARSHVAVVTIYANPFAMADSTGNLSGSGRLRRPVWATPPKPLQSLDDPLLRGEALISPTVVSSHAQLPGLPKQPNFPKSASVPAFPAAEKRSPLQPLEHRPSTSAGSDVSVPSRAVGSRIAFATCDAVAVDQLLYRLDNGQTLDAQNAQFAWKLGLQQRWQVPRGEILASAIRRGKIPKWGFPSFGRCRLVDEEVYSLEDESIDETVRDVIFGTVSAAQNAGFHVQVSRFDLFHGHFVQRRNGDVALLLHASEYPAMFLGMQKYMAWHAPVEDLFPTPIFQVSR
ncbi:hypothetical protein AK812_SmicGene8748 [Symbiodinium microadriaticum]|uniref:Uncharacterized protein n=1 Tax=Symbiodinium microadriaticum TaxID=2951 RepID=A0A1Q9EK51_SYMMI|nr:hypothetical protein AK812_SmicGene8748 [Symbiodinium microadriaticum]